MRAVSRAIVLALLAGLVIAGRADIARADAVVPILPAVQEEIPEGAAARASKAHDRAARAYERNDLKAALASATEAFMALPNASTALARAVILERSSLPRAAFEGYLVAAELSPTEAERQVITDGLTRTGSALSPPMAAVTLIIQPAGAGVEVDGVAFLAPRLIGLSHGRHSIRATAPGFIPLNDTFDTKPGGPDRVDLSLVVDADSPLSASNRPLCLDGHASSPGSSAAPWIVAGTGVAIMALGIGFHVSALDAAADTKHYAAPGADGLSDSVRLTLHRRALVRAEDDRTIAYAAYGIGAATVLAGIIVAATSGGDDADSPPPAQAWITPDGAGVGLTRRF